MSWDFDLSCSPEPDSRPLDSWTLVSFSQMGIDSSRHNARVAKVAVHCRGRGRGRGRVNKRSQSPQPFITCAESVSVSRGVYREAVCHVGIDDTDGHNTHVMG